MSRRTPTIAYTVTNSSDPTVTISDNQWCKYEAILGSAIPQSLREEIIVATQRFLLFAPFSVEAVPLPPARSSVVNLSELASQFLNALLENGSHIIEHRELDSDAERAAEELNDAKLYARSLIGKHLKDKNGIQSLETNLSMFINACAKANEEMAVPTKSWPSLSAFWGKWIVELTSLLEDHSLPTGVRKDAQKPSPFVCFIFEIHNAIPKQYRCGYAMSALPTAISKARRVSKA